MAKRNLDRNLPAKKYTHSNPTELRLSFEFEGNSTQFIDIAMAMSAINRKFVSQQAYFYVSKVELYNDEDAFVDIHTLPDTWVTRNAVKRGRAMFEKMNGLLDPSTSGIASAPYHDYKVYMSDRHRTTGSANPSLYDINSASVPTGPDEWVYTRLISADDDGDATQEADDFYLHVLGDHNGSSGNWNSIGLIKSYGESRTTVSNGGTDGAVISSDPLMNLFDNSSEEQINDIERGLEQFRNDLHDSMTPEEAKQLLAQQRASQEYFRLKYAWAVPAMKRRDQVLADPELVFKKWLERSLDELFNGAA